MGSRRVPRALSAGACTLHWCHWNGSSAGHSPCCPQLDSPQEEETLHGPLGVLGQELQRLLDIHWLGPIAHPTEEVGAQGPSRGRPRGLQCPAQPGLSQEGAGSTNKGSFKLRLNIPKPRKDKVQKQKTNSVLPGKACAAHAGRDPYMPLPSCPGHAVEVPSGRGTGHVLAGWGCPLSPTAP